MISLHCVLPQSFIIILYIISFINSNVLFLFCLTFAPNEHKISTKAMTRKVSLTSSARENTAKGSGAHISRHDSFCCCKVFLENRLKTTSEPSAGADANFFYNQTGIGLCIS